MLHIRSSGIAARSYQQLIDGELGASLSGERIHRVSPAHGVPVGYYPLADVADADLAVAAARRAFDRGPWPRMSGRERAIVLHRIADLIDGHADELALADVLESGKPISQARSELRGAADLWRFAAGEARSLHGTTHDNLGADMLGLVVRQPIGVVAMVTPWNFPFLIASQKLPFALAAGCTVVMKPSEMTPGSTLQLGELLCEADLPPGVVNLIVGYGATVGQRLADHVDVDMISFTGSTTVGRTVSRAAAANLKKVALELGGKNAQIICASANLEDAADAAVFAVLFNAGQCCGSGSRLLAHATIAEELRERMESLIARVAVGDPLDPATKVGAIVNQTQLNKIVSSVEGARQAGARVALGGQTLEAQVGLFFQPTLLMSVTPEMRVAREEIFGPVLSIMEFDTLEEAIAIANDSNYGLCGGIWTSHQEQALAAARAIRAGTVWVNSWMDSYAEIPFGGMRESGVGREQGMQAVEEFTEMKSILFRQGSRTARWVPRTAG
jgi:acyl-CoA reductase-like NAD-dependent aldehyde dehydrogenase